MKTKLGLKSYSKNTHLEDEQIKNIIILRRVLGRSAVRKSTR
jgi:hypothetical protein